MTTHTDRDELGKRAFEKFYMDQAPPIPWGDMDADSRRRWADAAERAGAEVDSLASWLQQSRAMERILSHMCAGYRVVIEAVGEDGSEGYWVKTESRTGTYLEAHGKTIPMACAIIAPALKR